MLDGFEWDDAKATRNFAKHRVSFEEAATVFVDEWSITIHDADHSITEDRYVTIGTSIWRRVLTVVHADREDRIRIISARKATPREKQAYEKDK